MRLVSGTTVDHALDEIPLEKEIEEHHRHDGDERAGGGDVRVGSGDSEERREPYLAVEERGSHAFDETV